MRIKSIILILIVSGLAFTESKSQSFFDAKNLSVNVNYGLGKIGYFVQYTPVYIIASNDDAVEYSPSWSFKLDQSFWLNDRFDFSLGVSHITITEKSDHTARPLDWLGFGEENITQGFLHLIPSFRIKLPDDRFTINLGIRIGAASNINSNGTRASSNSLLHMDFASDLGTAVMISKRFSVEAGWVFGLTKYDFDDDLYTTFFKYHSFQFGIRYILSNGKKH